MTFTGRSDAAQEDFKGCLQKFTEKAQDEDGLVILKFAKSAPRLLLLAFRTQHSLGPSRSWVPALTVATNATAQAAACAVFAVDTPNLRRLQSNDCVINCFLLPQPCWTTSQWWAMASGRTARRWSPTCSRVRESQSHHVCYPAAAPAVDLHTLHPTLFSRLI